MERTRYISTAIVALLSLASPRESEAQVDAAGARLLFDEARSLAKAGNFEAACPKFEQSYQRERGIGTLFNLADCWEHLGRTASAWAKFRDVADEAARTNQKAREQVALERASALLPKLSKLTVRVEGAEASREIRRDGVALDPSELGRPVPLDPGKHVLTATAPGKQSWEVTIAVPSNAQTVEVVVPALIERPAGTNVPSTVTTSQATALAPSDSSTRDLNASGSGRTTLAYVAAGVGLAGVVVGGIYGLRVRSKVDEGRDICPSGNGCSAVDLTAYEATTSEARAARTISYLSFGIGGVALATAATLYLTAPSNRSKTAWQIVPMVNQRDAGAVVRGHF